MALLVETVAKGGNLLLNVGPNADGTIPEIQERVLRESGAWVRAHADAIHGSTRFDVPGSGAHWYTRTGEIVHAFDLSSAPEPRFAALGGARRVATPAGGELTFRSESGALVVDARAVERHPFGHPLRGRSRRRASTSASSERRPGGAAREAAVRDDHRGARRRASRARSSSRARPVHERDRRAVPARDPGGRHGAGRGPLGRAPGA